MEYVHYTHLTDEDIAKFIRDSKQCGKCQIRYPLVKEASKCVTDKHNMIRCYFCFKVLRNTEALFVHYAEDPHKHAKNSTAGGPQIMECGFCGEKVLFKSVSTHVISQHIWELGPRAPDKAGDQKTTPKTKKKVDESGAPGRGHCPSAKKARSNLAGHTRHTHIPATEAELIEFQTLCKTCEVCKTVYPTVVEGSNCVTRHRRLRCYQCLEAGFVDTENLFEHYSTAHKEGFSGSGSLRCRFCSASVLFKSMSCHVIQSHLATQGSSEVAAAGPQD